MCVSVVYPSIDGKSMLPVNSCRVRRFAYCKPAPIGLAEKRGGSIERRVDLAGTSSSMGRGATSGIGAILPGAPPEQSTGLPPQ